MNILHVDYFSLIAKAEFGYFKFGTPWSKVLATLGDPPQYAPPGPGTNPIAGYGNLQFTIHDERVVLLTLVVNSAEIALPVNITMHNFEDPQLDVEEVEEILQMHGISWQYIELFSNEWNDSYRTSLGVHLSFSENLLAKISIADPEKLWGI